MLAPIPVPELPAVGDPPAGVTRPGTAARRAGWTAVVAGYATGAALIVVAYHQARTSAGTGHFGVFWAGVACVFVPTVLIGTRRWVSRRATALLAAAFGALTFLPKFLMSVDGPVFHDEFGHFRHANDLLATGDLFNPFPYLPIARYFPGLSALTVAVHEVTRLSVWHSGQLVVLAAHAGILVVVLLLARCAGLSNPAAFVATIVYALNPSYMYFDTQYSYESLALTLALLVVVACVRALRATTPRGLTAWTVTGVAGALGCIVTHHLSSVLMAVSCLALVALVHPDRPGLRAGLLTPVRAAWLVTGVAAVGTAVWLGAVATSFASYVWPHVAPGFTQLADLFRAHAPRGPNAAATTHSLFSGSGVPPYEKVAAFATPLIVFAAFLIVGLPFWRSLRPSVAAGARAGDGFGRPVRRRARPPVLRTTVDARIRLFALVLTALYLASLPIALTAGGGEGAHRSWGYTYLGVGIVVGLVVDRHPRLVGGLTLGRALVGPVLLCALLFVLCVGNVSAGEDVSYRFPGPYQFGTDTRSTTPEVTALMAWLEANVPAGDRVVTDRFTGEQLEGDTDLNGPAPGDYAAYVLYREGAHPDPRVRAALRAGGFRYFVLDTRIETEKPQVAFFEGYVSLASVNRAALAHMGGTPFARLVHETPNYQVYVLAP